MNSKLKAGLASYGRSFLAGIVTAVMVSGGSILTNLDATSARNILAAGLAAVLPVAIRALNKKDPSFGKIAETVGEAVIEKVTVKKTVKKTAKP